MKLIRLCAKEIGFVLTCIAVWAIAVWQATILLTGPQ